MFCGGTTDDELCIFSRINNEIASMLSACRVSITEQYHILSIDPNCDDTDRDNICFFSGLRAVWSVGRSVASSLLYLRRRDSISTTGLRRIASRRKALLMEKMPYQERADEDGVVPRRRWSSRRPEATNDWRSGLPTLTGIAGDACASCAPATRARCSSRWRPRRSRGSSRRRRRPRRLREVHRVDAPAARSRDSTSASRLCRADRTPRSACSRSGRSSRRSAPPSGASRSRPEFWGTGIFGDGAQLAIDFAFDVLGAHRLEARAVGQEQPRQRARCGSSARCAKAILRNSFLRNGEYHDQALWTILAEEWRTGHVTGDAAGNPLTSSADMDVRDFDFDLPA